MKIQLRTLVLPILIILLGARSGTTGAETTAPPDMVRMGTLKKIFDPSVDEAEEWCINDHCFVP